MSNRLPQPPRNHADETAVAGVRSRVVKARDAATLQDFSAFDPKSVQAECESELAAARAQAEQIRRDAEQTADEALRLAREEGHRQGLELAAREMDERVRHESQKLVEEHRRDLIERLGSQLASVAADAESERLEWCANWDRAAIELSVAIAERLIHRELRQAPDLPISMVRKSLEMIAGQQKIVVRLNPNDLEAFGADAESDISKLTRSESCQLLADSQVESGGCRVETQFGELDATLETQLNRIMDELQR